MPSGGGYTIKANPNRPEYPISAERVADGVNQTVLRQENWDRAGA